MTDIVASYSEFWEELRREADYSGEPQHACFFLMFARIAAENGDCADLAYAPIQKDGAHGYQVDGYALDMDRGELHLAICDFHTEDALQPLNQQRISSLFGRAERFFQTALRPEFLNSLEETSPAFEVAYPICEFQNSIKRVRTTIFSNARLASRKKGVEAKEISGRTFTHNLLDFGRYNDILASRTGSEPIEVALADLGAQPLPCLQAHTEGSPYESYLAAIPGELLARIYGLYGARLLEQNVRTFLQARTKVNKAIIQTIEQSPEMFFAYNNGLTATASGVSIERLRDGRTAISAIKDFQIVNGGQTTASILYAKDKSNADLGHVYVQMKLSVVNPDRIEEIVPLISRFANTQNRISEADFFASHPFHIEIEKISRRLSAPPKTGAFASSKWFYERARGQYKDRLAYGTPAARQRFLAEFPRDQVVIKTDLAKFELTFDCLPHVVSQGAQKCFLRFAEEIGSRWEAHPDAFNEDYFKEVVAKAVIFRWVDSMIGHAPWYHEDRGYKANIVTYSVAWLVNHLRNAGGRVIDFQRVWRQQDPGDGLKAALEICAPQVAQTIKAAPAEIKNVSEYAKHQACWAAVSRLRIEIGRDLGGATVDRSEIRQRTRDGIATKRIDKGIEFQERLLSLIPHVSPLRIAGKSRGLLSPKSTAALAKLEAGNINLSPSETNALKHLLDHLLEAGLEF